MFGNSLSLDKDLDPNRWGRKETETIFSLALSFLTADTLSVYIFIYRVDFEREWLRVQETTLFRSLFPEEVVFVWTVEMWLRPAAKQLLFPPPSISSASFSDSRHSLSVHSSSSSGPARPVKAPGGRARSVGRKRTILGLDDPAKKFPSLSMSVCALVIPPCLFYSFSSSLSSFRKRAAILKSSTVAHSPILDEEKINKTRSLKPGG